MATKMTWDSNADAQLLLAIIAEQSVSLNFESVAGRLGCTPRAVQERLKKLKKLAADGAEGVQVTPSKRASKKSDDTPTPKKRKTTTARAPKTPKKNSTPVKEEEEGILVSAEESGVEDSAMNTQASIKVENEEEDEVAGSEAILEDMDVQMLLVLQKVCNQKAIKLPWDEVGAQLGVTITGGAIIQHLAKLRAKRVEQGLPVPEPLKRGSGGSISVAGTAVNSLAGARKARSGKRPASLSFNNSAEDEEEDSDVDRASDPEASFGEVRKKKVKREIEYLNDEDDYSMTKKPKGGQSNKNRKVSKKIQTSLETKNQTLQGESSPEASGVATTERAKRRTGMNYSRLHKGESEYDTDDDRNEPYVAAGSSFLKLEGVASIGHKEQYADEHAEIENAENDGDAVEYEDEDGRYASLLAGQEDVETGNITVLNLGRSERSLGFLKGLDSSYTITAPLDDAASAVGRNVGYLPTNVSRRVSMDSVPNDVRRETNSESLNRQYFPSADAMNFRIGHHSQYNNGPYANQFIGSSSAPHSSTMPGFMPLNPVTGQGFTGLPGEFFGNNMENFRYHNPYGSGRSVQSMTAPQTPVIGGGFSGNTEYTPGAVFSNILPVQVLPSNILPPRASPSQIMQANEFPSLNNTRNNSMSTSATTIGQQNNQDYAQNNQDYAQNNNQAVEVSLNHGEKLTNDYPYPNTEQQDPIMGFDTGLNDNFLGGEESFGAVFNRYVDDSDGHNF
ncbi:hypothetical protein MMC11_001147 [Xylographa trunciseda]|nr:hypothetical protein [Xylographa trunciseda]